MKLVIWKSLYYDTQSEKHQIKQDGLSIPSSPENTLLQVGILCNRGIKQPAWITITTLWINLRTEEVAKAPTVIWQWSTFICSWETKVCHKQMTDSS